MTRARDGEQSVTPQKVILVVDDEQQILDVATFVLEDEGYSVGTASDGREALARVGEQAPDLIVLDMRMPVLDGWGSVKEYRARFDHQAPIIVLAAAADPGKRAEEIGAVGLIEKPFRLDSLVRIVHRLAS